MPDAPVIAAKPPRVFGDDSAVPPTFGQSVHRVFNRHQKTGTELGAVRAGVVGGRGCVRVLAVAETVVGVLNFLEIRKPQVRRDSQIHVLRRFEIHRVRASWN